MADRQDREIASRQALEERKNKFSRFYEEIPDDDKKFKRKSNSSYNSDVQKELSQYKHSEAIYFAAISWSWQKNTNRRLPRQNETNVPTFRSQKGNRAYYRVLTEKEDKYILLACHANLHAFHRGDLRFVEVNDRTIVRGIEKFSVIGMLYPGDVIAVTELAKKSKVALDPPHVFKVHSDADCTWEVRSMTLLTRNKERKVNFAILENGVAIVEGHGEAMNVTEAGGNDQLETDMMYFGTAFVPEKVRVNFTEDFHRKYEGPLIAITSTIPSFPNSLGTISSYFMSEEQSRLFRTGVNAFNANTFLAYKKESDEIVEKCVRMGSSAAQTVSNGRFDGRGFPMKDIRREGRIVRFSIANPLKQPTEGRWNNNHRIVLEGKCEKLNAIIETVVLDNNPQNIRIAARIPNNSPRTIKFDEGIWIVHQLQSPDIPKFDIGFFKNMHSTCNGRKVIETLYGGSTITINKGIDREKKYLFPSNPSVNLNEFQNDYVTMILADVPIVLGNSPFGCGKSMTIVTAAIEVHKRNNQFNHHGKHRQQLLVTQSNNAGVSLIDIARKIEKTELKFLRYVSENNWNVLPDFSKTELDMPKLMKELLVDWATENTQGMREFDSLTNDMRNAMVRQITQKYLGKGELRGEARRIYNNMKEYQREQPPSPRTLREAFFLLYQPDIIVTTADSIQGLISCNALKYISNVQIDEASQLPEHTLIYLLQTFPHAGFGLVGDIKQLPPHCEKELKGYLKDYGVGNTMERALCNDMFPQSVLLYVYRCHPKTTQLLSELFYRGQLISGIQEDQRNEFMRMRPDIWPNQHFPILVLNHEKAGYRMGTSVANEDEKNQVMRIVTHLTREVNGYKLKQSDIGVISFYRAQTSLLTEAFRGTEVKCGTVDSFQGTEREVMIVCCTNKKPSDFMKLGNRLNVAMSRARQATIIIGNVEGLRGAQYWEIIVQKAQDNLCLINEISDFGGDEQFDRNLPNGFGYQFDNNDDNQDDENEKSDVKHRTNTQIRRDRRRRAKEHAASPRGNQKDDIDSKPQADKNPDVKEKTRTQQRREQRRRAQERREQNEKQRVQIDNNHVAEENPKKRRRRPNKSEPERLRQQAGKSQDNQQQQVQAGNRTVPRGDNARRQDNTNSIIVEGKGDHKVCDSKNNGPNTNEKQATVESVVNQMEKLHILTSMPSDSNLQGDTERMLPGRRRRK